MIFLTVFFSTIFISLIASFVMALAKEDSKLGKAMKNISLISVSILAIYSFLLVVSSFVYLSTEKTEQLIQSKNVAYIEEEQSHCLVTMDNTSKINVEVLFNGGEKLTKLYDIRVVEGEHGENVLYTYKRELKNPILRNTFGLLIGKEERQKLHVSDMKLKVK